MHQGIKGINYGTEVDWYVRYLGINKSGSHHLGIVADVDVLN